MKFEQANLAKVPGPVVRALAVPEALGNLSHAVDELTERTNVLIDRLSNVMLPEEAGDNGKPGEPPSSVQLVYSIDREKHRIRALTEAIDGILSRLEV